MRPKFFMLAALAVLAGCATPNSQYYSLQSLPQANFAPVSQINDAINVQSVSVPAQVDRPQIVLTGRTGGEVSLLNESLWAAPLGDEIRQALAGHLSHQLGVPDIDSAGAPAGLALWGVRLTVHRFESVYGQQALLQASWRLSKTPANTAPGLPSVCRATAVVPASGGIDALVTAHQQALSAVSALIGAQIQAARQGLPVGRATVPSSVAPIVTMQGCTTSVTGAAG